MFLVSQESTAQPRKVRPKGSSSQAKPPKLEDLRVKVEPSDADPAAASTPLMPKQRLLIKIPRSAVTAATAHAAEMAAAEAASARAAATVKQEATDVRTSKRSKGKGGVKRARPLAGTRASSPPPPPPAPTNRQVRVWISNACFGGVCMFVFVAFAFLAGGL